MRSTLARLVALAATLTLTAATHAPPPEPEGGLLVGLADGRTLWLERSGDSMRVAWQGPQLVVPRRDGWWVVASAERCGLDIDQAHGGGGIGYDYAFVLRYQQLAIARAGTTVDITFGTAEPLMDCGDAARAIDSVRAHKYRVALDSVRGDSSKVADIPPPGDASEPGMDCVESSETPTFVSATALSVASRYTQTEYCAPGGYATSGSNAVLRFGTDSSIALRPMLTPAVRRKAERARKGDEENCAFKDTPERLDDSWIVRRMKGRWVADLWMDGPNVCRGGSEYEMNLPLPRSFTGEPPLPAPWSALEKAHPGLTDASASPSGAFVMLRDADSLVVHRLRAGRVAEALVRVGGLAYMDVVMLRWATPAEAARWSRELPAIVPPTVRLVDGCPGCDQ